MPLHLVFPQTSSRRPPHASFFNSAKIETTARPAATTKAIKWFTATGPAAFFPTERTTTPPPQPPPKTRRPRPRLSLEAPSGMPHKGRDPFSSKYFPTKAPSEGGHFERKQKPKRSSKATAKAIIQHRDDFKPSSDRRALREKVKEWTAEPETGDRNEVAIDYPKNENRKFPHFPPLDAADSSPDYDRKKGRPPKAKKNKKANQMDLLRDQLVGQLSREKAQRSSPLRFPGSKPDRGVRFPGPLSSPRSSPRRQSVIPEEAPTPAALKSTEEIDENFGRDFGHDFAAADSDSYFFPSSGKGRFLPFENAKFNGDVGAARNKKRKNGAGVAEKRARPSEISSSGAVESRRENWGRKVDNRKVDNRKVDNRKVDNRKAQASHKKQSFGLGQKQLEQLNKKRTELERKQERKQRKEAELLQREAATELLKLHEDKRHMDDGRQNSPKKSHQHFKLGVARENYGASARAPLTTPPPPVPRTTIQPIYPTYPQQAAAASASANPTAGPPYSPMFLGGNPPLPNVRSGYGAPDLYGKTVPKKFIQDNIGDHLRERRRDNTESKRKAANFGANHRNQYQGSQQQQQHQHLQQQQEHQKQQQQHQKQQQEKKSGGGGGLPVFNRPILKSEKEPSWFASFGPSGVAAPPAATTSTPRPKTASPTALSSYPRRSGEHHRQHPHPSSPPSVGRGDAGGRRSGGSGGVVLPPPISVTVRPYGNPPFPPPRGASAIDGEIKGRLRKQQSAAAAAAARSFHQQQIRIKKRPQPKLKPKPLRHHGKLLSPGLAIGGGGRRREEEELMRLQRERQRLLDLATAGPSLTAAATAAAFPFRAPARLKAANSRSGLSLSSSSSAATSSGNPFEDPFASRPLAFPAAFSGFGKSLPSSFAYSTSSRSPSPFGLTDTRLSRRRGRR